MPIDFNAHDAWTSDENVATFPSTVTTQSAQRARDGAVRMYQDNMDALNPMAHA